ncbi:remorin 4.1-like [Pyrus communis]|uniref:remorin 4.1-like n=1 Tax=Pyrus communis TaxID=23211 RepID=UPI0035C0F016
MNDRRAGTSQGVQDHHDDHGEDEHNIRDIHALTPPRPLPPANGGGRRREAWETSSQASLSMASAELGTDFTTMSREFSALVVAGSAIGTNNSTTNDSDHNTMINQGNNNLGRIGEEDNNMHEQELESNHLAIVPDNYNHLDPITYSPRNSQANNYIGSSSSTVRTRDHQEGSGGDQMVSVDRVKKEEVETKISAWQNNKIAKLNNRFKREDAIINGWESEQVQKASLWMKKVERKLEEKRARALEKMQNDIAKARRKAEERKASAEAKRGTKVARVLEIANLMRAVGRAPAKKSFF